MKNDNIVNVNITNTSTYDTTISKGNKPHRCHHHTLFLPHSDRLRTFLSVFSKYLNHSALFLCRNAVDSLKYQPLASFLTIEMFQIQQPLQSINCFRLSISQSCFTIHKLLLVASEIIIIIKIIIIIIANQQFIPNSENIDDEYMN